MRYLPLLVLALCPSVFGQSDDCSNATAIAGFGSWTFDTSGFTTSQFDGGGCKYSDAHINQDGFFVWTSTATGHVNFDTYGSNFDTRLRVHRGTDCQALCLQHNDDAWNLQSLVNFGFVAIGDVFLIQVGGLGNESGQVVLNISPSGCGTLLEDIYEDNDTPGTAVALAPAQYQGLTVNSSDPDYFQLAVPAGHRAIVWAYPIRGVAFFELFDANGVALQRNGSLWDLDQLWSFVNTGGALVNLQFLAETNDQYCTGYGLAFSIEQAGCINRPDDSFEDNDTCATPTRLTPGIYKNLLQSAVDPDVYEVLVPPGMMLNVVGDMPGAIGGIGGYNGPGSLICSATHVVADFIGNALRFSNDTGVTQSVLFIVNPNDILGGECYEYQLSVHLDPDVCGNAVPDAFDQSGQTWIEDGVHPNLHLESDQPDIYDLCVPAGGTLSIDVPHNLDAGQLWGALYEIDFHNLLAWTNQHWVGQPLTWTNPYNREMQVQLEVNMRSSIFLECNDYDLLIRGTCGCHENVGALFCPPSPNSLSTLGSIMTGDLACGAIGGGLQLRIDRGPQDQFGFVLMAPGMDAVGVPIGAGALCLRGSLVRFNRGVLTNSIGRFDSGGKFRSLLGNGDINGLGFEVPLGLPFSGTLISAGDTWHFQLWFRDQGGTSNFSTALSVTF